MKHVDLVIVGGGVVGATFAALIQNSPLQDTLRVLLIDGFVPSQKLNLDNFDPRVVALSSASTSILAQAGAWEKIVQTRACPYTRMKVWDADGTGNIAFSADDLQADTLGHIVENKVVLHALNDVLDRSTSLLQMRGEKLESLLQNHDGYELTLAGGEQIRSKMVIGADGSRSKVRELLNFSTKSWDYGHTAIVTTVETERSHEFCAWQRFSSVGPLAFLPLTKMASDSNTCSIVWSIERAKAEELMSLNDAEFKQELGCALEFRLGLVTNVDKRVAIPLSQCFAMDYVKPGCALVGDSAHSIHPLAGQGVNIGLYDVDALFKELLRAHDRAVPLTEMATLRRYQRARQPHNLMAMVAMECFKRGFGSEDTLLRYLRNTGLNLVDDRASIKRMFTKFAAGA